MSGIWGSLNNDKCRVGEYYEDSMKDANYRLEECSRVNPSFKNGNQVLCADEKMGCKKIQDSSATLNYGPASFAQRIDNEEKLRGTDIVLSKCRHGLLPGQVGQSVAFNPVIYERDLFTSNMETEFKRGFN